MIEIGTLIFHFNDGSEVVEYDKCALYIDHQQGRCAVDLIFLASQNSLFFIEVKDFSVITTLPKTKNLWFSDIDKKTIHSRDTVATADLQKYPEIKKFQEQLLKNEKECCVAHAEINRDSHSYLFPHNYHSIILQSMRNQLLPFFPEMEFFAIDREIHSRLSLPWNVTRKS